MQDDDNLLRLFFGRKLYFIRELDMEISKLTDPDRYVEEHNIALWYAGIGRYVSLELDWASGHIVKAVKGNGIEFEIENYWLNFDEVDIICEEMYLDMVFFANTAV